jgi:hypothetical protein
MRVVRYLAAIAFVVIAFPAVGFAQFGAIAGVVKDSSGAVLPGVTVEAASPALIEKARTAVSDSAGPSVVAYRCPPSVTSKSVRRLSPVLPRPQV